RLTAGSSLARFFSLGPLRPLILGLLARLGLFTLALFTRRLLSLSWLFSLSSLFSLRFFSLRLFARSLLRADFILEIGFPLFAGGSLARLLFRLLTRLSCLVAGLFAGSLARRFLGGGFLARLRSGILRVVLRSLRLCP